MKLTRMFVSSLVVVVPVIAGCASHEKGLDKDHEDNEVTVTMADVPAAVRATLERESTGGKVTEVEKETKKGKTVYSADMVVDGVAWDISVAEDGAVISKEKE